MSQAGRTFVVTGATGGLGLELTRSLAGSGARVVMAVRNPAKGGSGAECVRRTGATGPVEVRPLDLADLASVRDFAAGLDRVDVLINNAGVMAVPQGRTVDGFETQLATNHLGHFALANLLLPRITDRVVTVGSASHHSGVIDLDDLQMERGYRPYLAYARSKLAQLLFMAELQRRLTASGSTLRSTGGHPGYTATGIQAGTGSRFFTHLSALGNRLLGMPPSRGALPLLFAALEDVPGNSYVGPHLPGGLWGRPSLVGRSERASDPDLAAKMWLRSESLTGVACPV